MIDKIFLFKFVSFFKEVVNQNIVQAKAQRTIANAGQKRSELDAKVSNIFKKKTLMSLVSSASVNTAELPLDMH